MDKKFLNREGIEVVSVVTMRYGWEHQVGSTMLDFGSKKVKSVEPCVISEGKYYRIKDGQEVIINPQNMGTWPISIGTVFSWPDGEEILVSRTIGSRQTILLPKTEFTFNPHSMVRYNVR